LSRTAKQLAAEFTDKEWRRRFSELCGLLEMLADCIIASDYGVPDELNAAIVLTPSGQQLQDRLIRKENVPPKEARLMIALTLGHEDLFVDVDRVDLDKLRRSIERQLLDNEVRFPFVFGRELYDSYAELFEDAKNELGLEDTFRLLDKTPMGVYQYGQYVLGPFGLLKSLSSRKIRATRRVPAYHCSQPVCHLVHRTYLTTSQVAPINALRAKVRRVLDESGAQGSEWWGLSSEIDGFVDSFYSDLDGATLTTLVGDALTDQELALLVCSLLDHTKGAVRKVLPESMTGSSKGIVEGLARNELLQLVLLADEPQISAAIDSLVAAGDIQVADGEIRRPVVNEDRRSGAFGLSAELGHAGVRFTSDDPGLPALRLRRLLSKLYLRDNDSDTQELEWQLRGFDAEDLDERLEDFYQSTSPREALQRLILARKTNLIAACHEVRLENADSLSDLQIVDSVLWKLGFDVHVHEDPHRYFWDLQERLSSLTRSSRISGSGESETFRGVANTYFTELEGLLTDSLAFSAWLLLNDHTSSAFSFEYDDEGDRSIGLQLLQKAHDESANTFEEFDYVSDKVELFALLRGFAVLGQQLEKLEASPDAFNRPSSDYPDYDQATDLKSFVFKSVVPYLNLTPASRKRIRETLAEISTGMVSKEVHVVRNDYSHYRRNSREVTTMTSALEAVGVAVRQIENLGLARVTCWPTGVTMDPWGRSHHQFSGPRSVTHLFARPTNFDWMGLPELGSPQYIVHGAAFAEPNEVLRFRRRFDSPFAKMWSDYPKRRQNGGESASPATDNDVDVPETAGQPDASI